MVKICYNTIRSDKVEYTVTKKKIKNFIIRIYPDLRIAVSVPLLASNKDIENFVQNKKEWIETTLEKIKIVKENKNNLKENVIKILGKEIEKKVIKSDLERIRLTDTSIYIYSKDTGNAGIEKKLLEWKIEKLKAILDEYLANYTKLLNRNINYYQIKKLSSAWGIYHKKENYISFNFDLIEKDIECIEYVVLHELCHIFYMNHQKDFWSLVEKYMSDYKIRRKKLKNLS
ncbi:M48 family peptidase [Fusobacterium nucleatum subsp. nucleatum ATCC 25586]|uniref:M48 family peptidase n=1 Tax=Fusobacterium nucleatum subsp. nucleatum (strain ATCC 25586 / DSM 15643 / BCRC 10681 / CIP 101130 / JCM 8532 / KCTC 2640 / LMG 13131 / VPI 4355) TaxID=190304 RepID=Q8R661_FUSNN|nr:Zinc metalloprotease [Fusobacterium nucleatum subsp. nucleatum ATCC 25586]AVQ15309.1 M48 family peptidase [Fusobacterium nucleatum subsp. nucleatum ATCC 25586]